MRFIIVTKSTCAYQFSRDVYVRCGRYKLKTEKRKERERVAQESLQKLTCLH